MRGSRRLAIGLLLGLALLLSACSAETDITFYTEERWTAVSVFSFDPDLLPEIGIGGDIMEGLGLEFGMDTGAWTEVGLATTFDQLVNLYRQQGVESSWSKRRVAGGEAAYTLTAEGQGWDRLRYTVFQGADLSVTGTSDDGDIHFLLQSLPDESGLAMLFPYTFRLHGRKIIRTNAHEVRGGTAIWHSPTGSLEAVLTPASELNLATPLLIGGAVVGAAAAVGAGIFLYRWLRPGPPRGSRRPPRQRPSYRARRPTGRRT